MSVYLSFCLSVVSLFVIWLSPMDSLFLFQASISEKKPFSLPNEASLKFSSVPDLRRARRLPADEGGRSLPVRQDYRGGS